MIAVHLYIVLRLVLTDPTRSIIRNEYAIHSFLPRLETAKTKYSTIEWVIITSDGGNEAF